VILPDRNKKDLTEDIPEELRKGMTFIFAKTVDEVLGHALQPMDMPKGKGKEKDKAKRNGHVKLKTGESAPPSVDIVGGVPSSA